MHWRLATDDGFLASADELDDSSETAAVAEMLIVRVMASPYRAEPVPDTNIRAVRGGEPETRFPPLRLFYTAENGVVTLLRVERDRTIH